MPAAGGRGVSTYTLTSSCSKLQKPAAGKLTTAEPKQSSPSKKISERENATSSFFLIKCLHSPQSQEEPLPPRAVTGGL